MAKSQNPRQMNLSDDLSKTCEFNIPGLNKIKWWSKDWYLLRAGTNSISSSTYTNGLVVSNGTSSSNDDNNPSSDSNSIRQKSLKTSDKAVANQNRPNDLKCSICFK